MVLLARSRQATIGRNPTQAERIGLPIASVLLGSLVPILPMIATAPVLPPFGLLMLLAWRLHRREIWPAWMGLPLGLFDDLFSGQPFGSAMMLWTVALLIIEMLDRRMVWRDFKQDWVIAAMLTIGVLVIQAAITLPPGARWLLPMLPQLLLAAMCYPMLVRMVAGLDRIRHRR